MASGLFTTKVVGAKALQQNISLLKASINASVAHGMIEEYLLKKTQERFNPYGDGKFAQRRPSGELWSPPKNSALKARQNRDQQYKANQALVDTGALRNSIEILERVPSGLGFHDGIGTARIGIPASSPEYEKGLFHQFGGTTSFGVPVRARPFIGINKSTDVRAIEGMIKKSMRPFT